MFLSFYGNTRSQWALPVALFYLALVLLGVLMISEKNKYALKGVFFAILLPSLILTRERWYLMVVFLLLSYVLVLAANKRVKFERGNRITIRPHRLYGYGIAFATTAISLLVSAGFYFSIQNSSDAIQPEPKIEIPKEVVYKTLDFFASFYPNKDLQSINQRATVDDFIKESYKDTMMESGYYEVIQKQTGGVISSNGISSEALNQSRQELSNQLGMEINGGEEMRQVIADYINARIRGFIMGDSQSQQFLPLAVAFGLFLTLKTIAWILSFFLVWTTELVFRIMLWMKMIEIVKVQKEVEEIE